MNRYIYRCCNYQLRAIITVLVCLLGLCVAQSLAQICDDTTDHFIFTANTGDNYAIVVDSASLDCNLLDCDEIGVFDGDLCVGASVFRNNWPMAITAWKDDSQTETVDGYVNNNLMIFRIWHNTSDVEIDDFDVIYESGDGTFDSGPYARLSLLCNERQPMIIWVDDNNTLGPWYGTQANPYQTIQTAVDNAIDYDTIMVNSGGYNEHVNIENKSLFLMAINGPESTSIISGFQGCVEIKCCDSLELNGFTFTGFADDYSGGLTIDSSSVFISDCAFYDMTVYGTNINIINGLGICVQNSFIHISKSSFDNIMPSYTNYYGGCIYSKNSITSIEHCSFTNIGNYAYDIDCSKGGAIYADSLSSLEVNNSNFQNIISNAGGAIYSYAPNTLLIADTIQNIESALIYDEGGAVTIHGDNSKMQNCIFYNCKSEYGAQDYISSVRSMGGAISLLADYCVIKKCLLSNNCATGGHYSPGAPEGGAMYVGGNYCEIDSCVFDSNSCSDARGGISGGAAWAYGGAVSIIGYDCSIQNSIFSNNVATASVQGASAFVHAYGGAIYCGGSADVINNTFFNNQCLSDALVGAVDGVSFASGGAICNNGDGLYQNNIITQCLCDAKIVPSTFPCSESGGGYFGTEGSLSKSVQ